MKRRHVIILKTPRGRRTRVALSRQTLKHQLYQQLPQDSSGYYSVQSAASRSRACPSTRNRTKPGSHVRHRIACPFASSVLQQRWTTGNRAFMFAGANDQLLVPLGMSGPSLHVRRSYCHRPAPKSNFHSLTPAPPSHGAAQLARQIRP